MGDPLFDLTGRAIVITGGLGQLGRQFTRALLARGARVAVLDHAVSDEVIASRFGDDRNNDSLIFLRTDVTSRGSLEHALRQVKERFGNPQGLINNAAIDSPPDAPVAENGPFEAYPEASWEKIMAVNVKGPFLCCQVFGGAIAAAGRGGSIVNISSIYGLLSPDQTIYDYRRHRGETFYKPAAYSTSKSALFNLTRYLATYWAGASVRVNTLTLAGVFNDQDEAFLEAYRARIPIGRMAREDEYNGAVVFLLSDASAYMTGAALVVDGGWTAW